MEVRVGVQNAPRELVLDVAKPVDEVVKIIAAAIEKGPTLTLVDDKGRRVIVPADKLAYVEVAENDARRVGFGAI